jgi:hypothetical protein
VATLLNCTPEDVALLVTAGKLQHRAYAKRALTKIPSIGDYEKKPEGACAARIVYRQPS